jgi:hypothetical protein
LQKLLGVTINTILEVYVELVHKVLRLFGPENNVACLQHQEASLLEIGIVWDKQLYCFDSAGDLEDRLAKNLLDFSGRALLQRLHALIEVGFCLCILDILNHCLMHEGLSAGYQRTIVKQTERVHE